MKVCLLLACAAARLIPITNQGISYMTKPLPITHAIIGSNSFSNGKTVFSNRVLKKRQLLPSVPRSFPYLDFLKRRTKRNLSRDKNIALFLEAERPAVHPVDLFTNQNYFDGLPNQNTAMHSRPLWHHGYLEDYAYYDSYPSYDLHDYDTTY